MLFSELPFLSAFSVYLVVFTIAKQQLRRWILFIGSYSFYAYADCRFALLLLAVTALCYRAARLGEDYSSRRRTATAGAVLGCLAVLAFFKYTNFFADSFCSVLTRLGLPCAKHTLDIALPLGISFYIFRAISYVIDVSRGTIAAERNFIDFTNYMAFFPQILAGPIVRAKDLLPQLKLCRTPSADDFLHGFSQFLWGCVLKLVMADTIGTVINGNYLAPEFVPPAKAGLTVVLYSMQIYGDFAGYSLMSIGIARMLGFASPANFNRPYFSTSFQEFWRRWHISLSQWLRDYLYIPLGGNRNGHLYRNLFLTMVLGGLWHGAAWTFVVWGAMHGLFLCLERRFLKLKAMKPYLKLPYAFLVFTGVSLAWVFFRAPDFTTAAQLIAKAFTFTDYSLLSISGIFGYVKAVGVGLVVIAADLLWSRYPFADLVLRRPWIRPLFWAVCGALLLLLGTFRGNTFIYQQF